MNGSGWNLEYEGGVTMHNHTKIREIAPWVPPKNAKTVFLSLIQRRLSTTYPAPILSIFEIKDVNRCVHA